MSLRRYYSDKRDSEDKKDIDMMPKEPSRRRLVKDDNVPEWSIQEDSYFYKKDQEKIKKLRKERMRRQKAEDNLKEDV